MPAHVPIFKRIKKHAAKSNKKSKKSFKKSVKTTIKRKRQQRAKRKRLKLTGPKRKIFNGREFKRDKLLKSKTEAVAHKKRFMSGSVDGRFKNSSLYSMRVVKVKNGYGVYRRFNHEKNRAKFGHG